jgi:hypothetical protein
MAEKPWLLFEIEEGFHEELIYRNRNSSAALDTALRNINDALAPLTAQYQVGVLIYPVSLYDRNAYGKVNPQPIDCFHPALRQTLAFFESRADSTGVRVLLEAISSGNLTKQNGDIYSVPAAPLHNIAGATGVPALAFDAETLAAAKVAYPKAMKGIRLHETHYPRDINGNLVVTNGLAFGYDLPATVSQTLVDTCKAGAMLLVWNNSDWLQNATDQRDQGYLPYVNTPGKYQALLFSDYYKPQQDYAVAQLGADFILTNANNNYHPAPALDMIGAKATGATLPNWNLFDLPWTEHPIRTYPGLQGWGLSDQAWFWSEIQSQSAGRYYAQSEMACPVELIIAWTHRMLGQGARLIQYEPPWYFFNNGLVGTPVDGSERQNMKRLRAALLSPTAPLNPPTELSFYFDADLQKLMEFSRLNPPRLYRQDTLLQRATGKAQIQAYDFYNGMRNWTTGQAERLPAVFSDASITRMARVGLQGNNQDLVALARRTSASYDFLYFHDQTGRLLTSDLALLAPNAGGDVVAMAGANLIAEVKGEGDPDELVLARQLVGTDTLSIVVCKVTTYNSDLRSWTFKYNPAQTVSVTLNGAVLLGLSGVRGNIEDTPGAVSPLDHIVMLTGNPVTHQVMVRCLDATGTTAFQATLPGTYWGQRIACTAVDVDGDGAEELVLGRADNRRVWLDIYRIGSAAINWAWSQQIGTTPTSSVREWKYQ